MPLSVGRLLERVSKIYYLSPRKVHLFGIQSEAVREQINYVFDEDEIIGKGPVKPRSKRRRDFRSMVHLWHSKYLAHKRCQI